MKDDRIYLLHIRDAIDQILSYTAGGRAEFLAVRKTQDSVVRNIEIIGEAVKNVSEQLKQARPDVLWKRIAGCEIRSFTNTSVSTSTGVGRNRTESAPISRHSRGNTESAWARLLNLNEVLIAGLCRTTDV